METNIKAQVELFHLLFLEQLSLKLDKRLYALKGGCNLRFFFNSIRYSEDIDIDVHTVAVATLEKTVSKILQSTPFKQILTTRAMSVADFSTPKQTDTTQRWKVKLKLADILLEFNTKIEFSRRQTAFPTLLEPITNNITLYYKLRPIYLNHYPTNIALQQKVNALIMRTETQARDIFDIDLLLRQDVKIASNYFNATQIETAIANTQTISFGDFKSQVISYLENDYIQQYSEEEVWTNIKAKVINYLSKLNEHH